MKKLLLVLLAVASLSTVAVAQSNVEKGKFIVGANVTELNLDILQDFSLTINAGGGYFIADNFAILGQVSAGFADEVTLFGLFVGAGYYIMPTATGAFNVNAMVGFNTGKVRGYSDTAFGAFIGAGYSFFLNERVSLDPMLNVGIPFEEGDVSLGLGIGFSIYF